MRRMLLLPCLVAALLSAGSAERAGAADTTEAGIFHFDIDSDADMREVGQRSGIQILEDAPLALGQQECRRWANQFHVRPYRAVVSGRIRGRPDRVWICAGPADHDGLSQLYCEQMGMTYVRHEGSKVTCRLPDRT